ncbi:helix-turn-helix domain-containing protein [Aerococcus viridans]
MKEQNEVKLQGVMAKGYGTIPKVVMQDEDLSIEAKAIYAYIASYAGAGHTAFPSVSITTKHLGISKNRYYKHRKYLEDKGYISIERLRTENGFSKNIYTLNSTVRIQNVDIRNEDIQNVDIRNVDIRNEYTNNNSSNNNNINNNSNKKDSQQSQKRYADDSQYMKAAVYLFEKIKERLPNKKEPDFQKWADEVRKTVELDGVPIERYKQVLDWSQNDDFWQANILSTNKLRKQFDTIYLQMQRDSKQNTPKVDGDWDYRKELYGE